MYGKGKKDITFVLYYTVVFSFTREFLMLQVLRPLALWNGIRSRVKQARFMEQAYTAMYFAVLGPFGMYVMSRGSLWFFDTTAMFEGFPHRQHEGFFKAYYLLQAGYWSQQALVLLLQLEKPRKDFKELVLHHVVTLSLIALSYRFHFAKMGIAVYITHDISDFFLAVSSSCISVGDQLTSRQTSKLLNYIDSMFVGPYFIIFVGIWVYLRHYINLCIIWAVCTEFKTVGPYELNWETQQYKCWISQIITFALLAILQSVNVFWLYLILRIAKNYVFSSGQEIEDIRSDTEETEDEDTTNGPAMRVYEKHVTMEAPAVLLNGKAIEGHESSPAEEAVRERKRRKA